MTDDTVLVAYASKHGSTAEIAERIAKTLRDAGRHADAREVDEVHDLSPYTAVVLGSAVYGLHWRRAARRFARRHRRELADMPVWLFSSGPLGDPVQHPRAPIPGFAEDLARRIDARAHVMFGGRVPEEPSNFVERAMARNTPPSERDARDWAQIEMWAREIAHELATRRHVAAPV